MSGSAFPQIPISLCLEYSHGVIIVTRGRNSLAKLTLDVHMPNHATWQARIASIRIHLVEVASYGVIKLPDLLPIPRTEEPGSQL